MGERDTPSPFPLSLCHRCVAKRDVRTARSVFLLCTKLPQKYPPQPVAACRAFEAAPPAVPNDS